MSFFNYLSARQYSLDSTNYGAPSNATINTDYLGDIVLNPSASATVIVPSLALNSVELGATTNPTITTDSSGNIYLNPITGATVNVNTLSVSGTPTFGNTANITNNTSTSTTTFFCNENLIIQAAIYDGSPTGETPSTLQLQAANTTINATNSVSVNGSEISLNGPTSVGSATTGQNLTVNGELSVTGTFNAFGTIQSGPVYAQGVSGITVDFVHAFSSAPIVVCTPTVTSSDTPFVGIIVITAATTTSFTCQLYNYDGTANSANVYFNWIAMVAS